MSQRELAERIGRHQTAIGPYERGEYAPPREIVEQLAVALETSPEYLAFGRDPHRATLPVIGRVGPGGLLFPLLEPAAPGPKLAEERLEALCIEDDSMAPVIRPGQLAIVAAGVGTDPCLWLGREVAAQLADGRQLLRRLAPAALKDRFDLAALAGPTLQNVELTSARPVIAVLWPEAVVWHDGRADLFGRSGFSRLTGGVEGTGVF
jgi:transcriptional regulator with XRE-family HTH domain